MSEEIVVFSRYEALGIPVPDLATMCQGPCEGTGVFPCKEDGDHKALWLEAEAKKPTDDGWHFVTCPDCQGTGRKPGHGDVWNGNKPPNE